MSEREDVLCTVRTFFEIGRSKDLARLGQIQSQDGDFTYFGENAPFELQGYSEALALEELKFVSLSDYNYNISKPQVEFFGSAAVAAFGLEQSGMAVDTKSFSGTCVRWRGRGTFVLKKSGASWKIVHIHLSAI